MAKQIWYDMAVTLPFLTIFISKQGNSQDENLDSLLEGAKCLMIYRVHASIHNHRYP